MVSLKVPSPAGSSCLASQTMWKRPVSLLISPTDLVPVPCHDPTGRLAVTTFRAAISGDGRHDTNRNAAPSTARTDPLLTHDIPLSQPVTDRVQVIQVIGRGVSSEAGHDETAG